MRKILHNPRHVLLLIIGTIATGGIGLALWGQEYGYVLAASVVLAGCIVSFIKQPISE